MPTSPVLYEVIGHIAKITLNRPDNRNSMDHELLPAFEKAILQVKGDALLRCVVITGTGSSFCAGADFKSKMTGTEGLQPHEVLMNVYAPFLSVGNLEIPVVAAMNGHAVGGGLALSMMCDIRIASTTAKYGANFAKLGLHSGVAISYVLPRLVGLAKTNELILTGRLIDGEEAERIGLVNYAVEQSDVLEKAWAMAEEIASCAPLAIKSVKRSILAGLNFNPGPAAEMDALYQSRSFETEDAKEGIAALLEKRPPVFKGK